MASTRTERDWHLRAVAPDLAREYAARGWWTDETVGQVVERGLGAMTDTVFTVRSAVRPWHGTFGEVDRSARALAGSLHERGVGPGDVVVLQLPNWVEAGIAYWAAAYLGAVVVPIVHFYGPKEVGYILRTVEPDVVITPAGWAGTDHLAMYDALLADDERATWLVVGDADTLPSRAESFDSLLGGVPIAGALTADPDAPAVIAFTSGTTRDPKGVIHSHRTILCETRQLNELFPEGGPPQITGAPVGHFIGMVNAFLVPLLRRRPVHLVDVWDPGKVLALMREEDLGMSGGATYFLTSLLDHPDFDPEVHLPKMPFAGLGGSPVPLAVTERATRLGIKVFRSYGSTEHPSITGCHLDDPEAKRLTTDGDVLEGVEIRLDPDTGEIHSRGPDCFLGYTDPALTAKVFDADGWYRTGDVGVLDDEGFLAITDRISDIIIRGGENISAAEVEEVLATMAGVAEVAVVAAPDERLGEHAAAFLRMLPGVAEPTLADLRAHMATAGIAKQKWPESLAVLDELPRTASGKVQKFRLRQQLREERLTSHE
ncbi:MAG TPA: AMP-binding protein [Nocardioides sp.]|nr:AMP-binding protein [Nocardioides sp.]